MDNLTPPEDPALAVLALDQIPELPLGVPVVLASPERILLEGTVAEISPHPDGWQLTIVTHGSEPVYRHLTPVGLRIFRLYLRLTPVDHPALAVERLVQAVCRPFVAVAIAVVSWLNRVLSPRSR